MIKKWAFILAIAVAMATAGGCAQQSHTLISKGEDLIVADQKPKGYPRTVVEPYPGYPEFCRRVVEDFVQHEGVDRRQQTKGHPLTFFT